MTYDEFQAEEDDLIYDLRRGAINEDQFYRYMEDLQEQWEEEGTDE